MWDEQEFSRVVAKTFVVGLTALVIASPGCGGESWKVEAKDESMAGAGTTSGGAGGSTNVPAPGASGTGQQPGKGGAGPQVGKGGGGAQLGSGGSGAQVGGGSGPAPRGGTTGFIAGGSGGESGTGAVDGVGGCTGDGSSVECEYLPRDYCLESIPFNCPYTLEGLRHTLPLCDSGITNAIYKECDKLVSFEWSAEENGAGGGRPDPYSSNELQFSPSTGELLAAEYTRTDSYNGALYFAGSLRKSTNCRSCAFCPTDAAGGANGIPGVSSEACRFDSKGRISLPPLEE